MAESDKPSRADDEIAALRAKYEAMTGKSPFAGWSAEMLQSGIAAAEDLEPLRHKLKSRRRWEQFEKALFPWLLFICYHTRAFCYIVGFGLWLAGWYLLLRKQWELPLGSIPLGELVVTVASAIIWGWLGFNVHKRYHRSDDDPDKREYEHFAWGLSSVAIAIAVIVGAAALWLTYG